MQQLGYINSRFLTVDYFKWAQGFIVVKVDNFNYVNNEFTVHIL